MAAEKPVKTPAPAEVPVSHTEIEPRKVPAERMMAPFDEMEKMFERMWGGAIGPRWMRPWQWEWPRLSEMSKVLPFAGRWPQVDVIDRETEVVIRAEVPGVDRKDLSVTVTDDTVTIRGEKKREEKVEKGDYYRCEIERGEFVRTVALPAGVNGAKAKATFKDGVLELSLPKTEKIKRHNVTID